MCGIAGYLDTLRSTDAERGKAILHRMTAAIRHRGPDHSGQWMDAAAGIALGHRRLSIIDLSEAGNQPMISADGRYVVVFNGEIYNYRDLRAALETERKAPPWRGHSDTEVMLAAICAWGLKDSLRRFNAMFALALWDRHERTLTLARDRTGEKPLYYGWQGNVLLFGSELKALTAHPDWKGEIDRDALAAYARYCYVPTPFSIYRGVFKLEPASFVTFQAASPGHHAKAQPYWSACDVAEAGVAERFKLDDHEATDELDRLLRQAVGLRMEADVPLGAFLSGGVDSSAVVALMQAQSLKPVKTFTIGFRESDYDEARYARKVAEHLKTEHTDLYVTPQEAMNVIPLLPQMYDEPFSDSSQIPTYLVSQLARRHVTVSLSGDGGDELFGGYNRYFQLRTLRSRTKWVPQPLMHLSAAGLTTLSPSTWDRIGGALPARWRIPALGDKLHKMAEILPLSASHEIYLRLVSHWDRPCQVVRDAADRSHSSDVAWQRHLRDDTDRMMLTDLVTYLPDDILVKLDRASMSVSLESRVPLLDPDLIAFAWKLPLAQKIRGNRGKWLFRRVLDRYVPSRLIERPKMGFGLPVGAWLRGPLREWAETLLGETRLVQEGWFTAGEIRRKWCEHLSGTRNWHYQLWNVLMFQAWLEAHAAKSTGRI